MGKDICDYIQLIDDFKCQKGRREEINDPVQFIADFHVPDKHKQWYQQPCAFFCQRARDHA